MSNEELLETFADLTIRAEQATSREEDVMFAEALKDLREQILRRMK